MSALGAVSCPLIFPLSESLIGGSSREDSDDGRWSSFAVQVGKPPQTVRLLPSTSGSAIWVVLPNGCSPQDGDGCPKKRGDTFNVNASTSFSHVGTYFSLPFDAEASLGYTGTAEVGYDDISFGWAGSPEILLQHQVVMGYAAQNEYLGELGLTSRPVNITSFNDQHPSPLGTLRSQGNVSTSVFAYTAGASYQQPPQYGSLTFGGFDTLRGNVHNVLTVPQGLDTTRDLLVWIQGIQIQGHNSAVSGLPALAFVDSSVPGLWLPSATCQAFEDAFGIVWDQSSQLYLVNDTTHQSLLSKDASVTFSLGSAPSGGSAPVQITLPYAAFDMTATYPLFGSDPSASSRYFPLMRAANQSQYTLGRAFLQEAYLVVDYDRSTLSVSQATFPPDPSQMHLQDLGSSKSRFGGGAIAGVVVAAVFVVTVIIAIVFLWFRRKQARRAAELRAVKEQEEEMSQQHEQSWATHAKPELDGSTTIASPTELMSSPGEETRPELGSPLPDGRSAMSPAELSTQQEHRLRAELGTDGDQRVYELDAGRHEKEKFKR